MKKPLHSNRIRCAFFLLILTLVIPASADAQKIQNPSFEEAPRDKEKADQALYWGRWGPWINRETSWKPTRGGQAMFGYHHWRLETDDESGFYQDIADAEAGAMYEFTIYAFKDPKTNAREIEIRIEEHFGGEVYASQVYDVEDLSHSGWRKLSVVGKSDKPGIRVAVRIQPQIDAPKEGAIKFDDAKLSRVDNGD